MNGLYEKELKMNITKELGRTPIGYGRITVTGAAVVRLDTTLRARARGVFCTVEDETIRYRIDGGDPSVDVDGHVVVAGSNLYLIEPHAIDDLRMIANGAQLTAIVIVTYYF